MICCVLGWWIRRVAGGYCRSSRVVLCGLSPVWFRSVCRIARVWRWVRWGGGLLRQAWRSLAKGCRPCLEPVGTSFRRWAELLLAAAEDPTRLGELPLWTAMLEGYEPALGSRPLDRQ